MYNSCIQKPLNIKTSKLLRPCLSDQVCLISRKLLYYTKEKQLIQNRTSSEMLYWLVGNVKRLSTYGYLIM